MNDTSGQLMSIAMVVVGALVYFVPTIVANKRDHRNTTAIVILNIFLGWTFIGWVVALVWACTDNRVASAETPPQQRENDAYAALK